MVIRLVNVLKNRKIFMMTVSEKQYASTLIDLAAHLHGMYDRVAVLDYRTASSALEARLNKKGIKTKNFIFLDAVSKNKRPSTNKLFLKAPSDLNELGTAVESLISNVQLILFDDPGAMLKDQNYEAVLRFLHTLITKCRIAGVHLALFASDSQQELIRDLHLFVDEVFDVNSPISEERLAEVFK